MRQSKPCRESAMGGGADGKPETQGHTTLMNTSTGTDWLIVWQVQKNWQKVDDRDKCIANITNNPIWVLDNRKWKCLRPSADWMTRWLDQDRISESTHQRNHYGGGPCYDRLGVSWFNCPSVPRPHLRHLIIIIHSYALLYYGAKAPKLSMTMSGQTALLQII